MSPSRPCCASIPVLFFVLLLEAPAPAQPPAGSPGPAGKAAQPAIDPSTRPTEELIRLCTERIEEKEAAFQAEIADYSRRFSNNPPGSFAVRSTIDSIVEKGEVAVPFLLDALRSDITNLAANAASTLERLHEESALGSADDRVYRTLLSILEGGPDPARGRAASVLLRFDGEEHRDRLAADLMRLLPKEPETGILRRMVQTLGGLGVKEAVPGVTRLLADDRFEIRSDAARALGRIASPASIDRLVPLLADPSHEVRRAALLALGDIGTGEAAAVIHPRLHELARQIDGQTPLNEPLLQEALLALRALGAISHPGSLDALLPLLGSENWKLSQTVAATVQGILDSVEQSSDAAGHLNEILAIAGATPVKLALAEKAFEALRALRDPASIEPLEELLWHEDENIALNAARTLGAVGNEKSVRELRRRFREVDGSRRSQAQMRRLRYFLAKAMCKLGDYKELDVLTDSYMQRIRKDRSDIKAHEELADVLREVGKPDRALRYYRNALREARQPSTRARLTWKAALCHALQGDFDDADRELENARELGLQMATLLRSSEMRELEESADEEVRNYSKKVRRRYAPSPAGSASGGSSRGASESSRSKR